MQSLTALWIVGSSVVVALLAGVVLRRRGRSQDLGSVSTAWTTEHNAGDRGGDRSRS